MTQHRHQHQCPAHDHAAHQDPAHQHPAYRRSWDALPEGFADYLEVESRLVAPLTESALDRAEGLLDVPPSSILDLGSGTGADTVAVARRFPTARVHALDVSAELLDRVQAAGQEAGVADRIHAHRLDLDQDWSGQVPTGVDLIWAALSLHHLEDPAAALHRVFSRLRPGGAVVLIEMSGQELFSPADLGTGRAGLQDRLGAPEAEHAHRLDWAQLLAAAGFTGVEHREDELLARADTADGARYLERQLSGRRDRLADPEDLAGLDAAIDALRTGTSQLEFRSGRTVWTAVRPQAGEPGLAGEAGQAGEPGQAADPEQAAAPEVIDVDVAVVGGGAAGLAASVALARSRRRVAVIDAGQPRNAPAEGAHNVLGQEGIAPHELLARGRAEAESYGVRIIDGRAIRLTGAIDDFTLDVGGMGGGGGSAISDGSVYSDGSDGSEDPSGVTHRVRARRIILASGLVDDLPDIPGVAEGWGRTVLHCPFCHGWEVRDQRIAILARDEVAIHQAILFGQLSDRVTLFLHEAADPTDEQREQLEALGVGVVRPRVERLVMDGAGLRAVQIEGGQEHPADAAVVVPRFNARTELYESLGGSAEQTPFGRQVLTDPRGATPVPGVWAAGNAGQPMAMVVASAASGVATGAAVHGDLAVADLDAAVRARRAVSD